MPRFALFCIAASILAFQASAYFYVPGVTAITHEEGGSVNITVNALRSIATVTPYSYYHLPFCRPVNREAYTQSLAQFLVGDARESSPYVIGMKVDKKCAKVPCIGPDNANNVNDVQKAASEIGKMINEGYRGYMSIDNLPGFNDGSFIYTTRCNNDLDPATVNNFQNFGSARGYALGVPKWCKDKTYLNNHLIFKIKYHQPDPAVKRYTVVGFNIVPRSVDWSTDSKTCDEGFNLDGAVPVDMDEVAAGRQKVTWTYAVEWTEDNVTQWTTRWDAYLSTSVADSQPRVHWVYIINSLLIAICLCVIAGMILMRTLHKDCNDYNSQDPDSLAEEMGWKLVHADVFRTPRRLDMLAICLGNGVQFLLVCTATLFGALLGFLSPANRGALLGALIIAFALFSMASGWTTAVMLKQFDRKQWKTIFGAAMIFPGAVFGFFLLIDIVNVINGASDALPFREIVVLAALWVGSCITLNVLGAAYGFSVEPFSVPCKPGKIARDIPQQRWWLATPAVFLIPATFPFVVIFLELKFIFASLWLGMVYYAFTFLFLVFLVWIVTTILTAITVVYHLLAHGDHRWMWRSFQVGFGIVAHFMLYTVYFYAYEVNITTKTGTVMYFVYMTAVGTAVGLMSGTLSFIAGAVFVRKIYSMIRID